MTCARAPPLNAGNEVWKEFIANFEKWLTYTCYLMFAWVFVDLLPYLPVFIVDRVIEAVLRKLGI